MTAATEAKQLADSILSKDAVVTRLGVFFVERAPPQRGINPISGGPLGITGRVLLRFSVGKELASALADLYVPPDEALLHDWEFVEKKRPRRGFELPCDALFADVLGALRQRQKASYRKFGTFVLNGARSRTKEMVSFEPHKELSELLTWSRRE